MIKILLYKTDKHYWFDRIVHTITGSWYYHAAIQLDDFLYESTAYFDSEGYWHNGVQQRFVGENYKGADRYIFKKPLTKIQEMQLKEFIKDHMAGEPYNFPKLIGMMIIYPTRWFWKLIGWVPFSASINGYICSVFVDRAFKAIGIDLLPEEREGYTSPGDLAQSKLLVRENQMVVSTGVTG